jgi:DNA-binding PadR family transcriptional regulator
MYGLEIVQASGGALGRASVYVTLARLQEKGFVMSRKADDADHPGLPRPLYRLTALGEPVLRAAEAAEAEMGSALARAAI